MIDLRDFDGFHGTRQVIWIAVEMTIEVGHTLSAQILHEREEVARIHLKERDGQMVKEMPIALVAAFEFGMGALALGDVDHAGETGGPVVGRVPNGEVRVEDRPVEASQARFDGETRLVLEGGEDRLRIVGPALFRPYEIGGAREAPP